MKYLIDTHILIWFGETNDRLPIRFREIIEDTTNAIYVSHASIWEMTIKMSLGKLKVIYTLAEWEKFLLANKFTLLPTSFKHYQALQSPPFHHQDPFDRLMIAQAIAEDFTFISHDPKFSDYPVKLESF
ncbi:MAG: type II toxin-antitoxin system VapC family toxin [Saprospiraceae bacterium]|nr:type II toxin-antitoxin system VapC family toxin [Saprospiraceae bacterium]